MIAVLVESPFAGDVERNLRYLRACLRDCLKRGEAPFASHAIYTLPGVLDDNTPSERALGIEAGLLIGSRMDKTVVYCDMLPAITRGMRIGIARAEAVGRPVEYRRLSQQTCFEQRFWQKVQKTDSCWLWTAGCVSRGRYGYIGAGARSAGKVYAHRASYKMHIGPIEGDMLVCHRCDEPRCVNPEHLFLGTHEENMADAKLKGRNRSPLKENPSLAARGERAAMAKLDAQAVRDIRAAAARGCSHRELAKQYGVVQAQVSRIVNRRHWKHVS